MNESGKKKKKKATTKTHCISIISLNFYWHFMNLEDEKRVRNSLIFNLKIKLGKSAAFGR